MKNKDTCTATGKLIIKEKGINIFCGKAARVLLIVRGGALLTSAAGALLIIRAEAS